jgi:hypothetical protein
MAYPTKIDCTIYLDRKDSEDVIVLDGTTAQYIIRNPFDFGGAIAAFTFETWMETKDLNNAGTILSYAVAADFDHILLQDYRDLELTIQGVSSGSTGIEINDEIPHHVAITWQASDGATVLYIDGHERWSGTLGTGSLTDDGSIVLGLEQGSVGGTFSNGFIGEMWDARFWTDVRTQDEIFHHMNHRLAGSETALRAYWELDEGTGTNADDSTANNIDGTIHGTGVWTTTAVRFFTDVTAYLNLDSFSIISALTNQIDTAELALENAGVVSPSDWDEIAIYDGALTAETRIFGGYVTDLEESEGEGAGRDFNTGCGDYGSYLDHVFIKAEYEDKSDAYIIDDLFGTYAQQYDAETHVETVKTHDKIRFNRVSLREIMDTLADLAQGDWYVDYERRVHFFVVDIESAPFGLSDSPDLAATFPYEKMKIKTDGAGVINRVEVVGGNYLSADATFYLQGTGEDERIIMPFRMHAADGESALQVWVNKWAPGINLAKNPTFEVNVTDDTSIWVNTGSGASASRSQETGTGESYSGIACARIDVVDGGTDIGDIAFWSLMDGYTAPSADTILAGQMRVRSDVALPIVVYIQKASSPYTAYAEINLTLVADTWTEISGISSKIPDGEDIRLTLVCGHPTWTNYKVYVDAMMPEEAKIVNDYFDGSLDECAWDGTANNSTSTRTPDPASASWSELTVKVGHIDSLDDETEVLHSDDTRSRSGPEFGIKHLSITINSGLMLCSMTPILLTRPLRN